MGKRFTAKQMGLLQGIMWLIGSVIISYKLGLLGIGIAILTYSLRPVMLVK